MCQEVGNYANKCKNRKNNKFSERLDSIDYFEISDEEKAIDLALKNNKGIVEILMDDEYKESECKETSHMMEVVQLIWTTFREVGLTYHALCNYIH